MQVSWKDVTLQLERGGGMVNAEGIENAIQLKQTGEIESRLAEIAEMVGRRTTEAMAMVATEETLKAVRAYRSELKKDLAELEAQRKAVKTAYMAPYKAFEAEYKKLISDPFNAADSDLKAKINAVESDIKGRMEEDLLAYIAELKAVHGLEWLDPMKVMPKIGLTDARGSGVKLKKDLADRVAMIAEDCKAIAGMENSAEIMAEYQSGLSLATAVATVQARKKAAEAVRADVERMKVDDASDGDTGDTVAVSPAPVPEPIMTARLTIYGTRAQLVALKQWMADNGLTYRKG